MPLLFSEIKKPFVTYNQSSFYDRGTIFFSFSDGKKLVRIQLIVSERPVSGRAFSAKIKLLIGVVSDRKIASWKSSESESY